MKYFRDRIAGSETLQALASFSVLMAVQVGGNLATLAYTLIFVRLLTPEQFGTVSSLWAMSLILVPFAMLNLAPVAIQAVVKARQQGDDALAAGFFRFARRVVLYSSPLVIALFVLVTWVQDPELLSEAPVGIGLMALGIIGVANIQIGATIGLSLDRPVISQFPRILVRPLVVLAILTVYWAAGWPLSLNMALLIFPISVLVNLIVQYIVLRTALSFADQHEPRIENPGHWISTGFLLLPSRIIGENLKNILIVSAALVLSPEQVAVITVALSLIGPLNFALTATEMAFSAKLSRALHAKDRKRTNKFLAIAGGTKIASIVAFAPILFFLLEPILGFFGKHYSGASDITLILLGIPVAKALFGRADLVLLVHNLRARITIMHALTLALLPASTVLTVLMPEADALRVTSIGFFMAFFLGFAGVWWIARRKTGIDTSAPGAIVNWLRDRAAG